MEGGKLFIGWQKGFYFELNSTKSICRLQPLEQKLQFALEWVFSSHHSELVIDVKNTVAVIIAVFVILHTIAIIVFITVKDAIAIVVCIIWNSIGFRATLSLLAFRIVDNFSLVLPLNNQTTRNSRNNSANCFPMLMIHVWLKAIAADIFFLRVLLAFYKNVRLTYTVTP